MKIVVYRIAGKQGWLNLPDWVCEECDLTVTAVREACRAAGIPEDTVDVRPWLVRLGEAWRSGARHPPAVLVNGRLFSQENVPDVSELAAHLSAVKTAEAGSGT